MTDTTDPGNERPTPLARARLLVPRPSPRRPGPVAPASTDAALPADGTPPDETPPDETPAPEVTADASVPDQTLTDHPVTAPTARPRPSAGARGGGGRGLARRPSPAAAARIAAADPSTSSSVNDDTTDGAATNDGAAITLVLAEPTAEELGTDPDTRDAEPDADSDANANANSDADTDSDGAEPPPAGSRAGRNLPAAIAVGLGLGALIIVSLFAYRPSFAGIVTVAALYAVWEIGQAVKHARIRITLGPLLVGAVAMQVAAWQRGTDGLAVAGLITVAAVVVWRIADGAHAYTRDTVASVLTALYVPLLASFASLLAHPHDGAGRVLVFVGTVVCSDTGGYATGVLFGKHPLAPVVSKAKTWEGFAGSVIACSAAGILFFTLTFHQDWWKGLLYGLAIVVTATLGDLGESMIKRDLGIKDMGRLLPGHGGVMDRLDSLLPCAVVAYLLLTHLAPT